MMKIFNSQLIIIINYYYNAQYIKTLSTDMLILIDKKKIMRLLWAKPFVNHVF